MRLNLKKDFLLVTTMLVAVGCSDSMTEESDSEQRIPIVFALSCTRAVVVNKEGMDNFTLLRMWYGNDGLKLFSMLFGYSIQETMARNVLGCGTLAFMRCIRKR